MTQIFYGKQKHAIHLGDVGNELGVINGIYDVTHEAGARLSSGIPWLDRPLAIGGNNEIKFCGNSANRKPIAIFNRDVSSRKLRIYKEHSIFNMEYKTKNLCYYLDPPTRIAAALWVEF